VVEIKWKNIAIKALIVDKYCIVIVNVGKCYEKHTCIFLFNLKVFYEAVYSSTVDGDIAIDDVDLELDECSHQPTVAPGPITTAGPPTHG
jgi:hypothetical protein